MNSQQKNYLILVVKSDIEVLTDLVKDDPKRWQSDYDLAISTLQMLEALQ